VGDSCAHERKHFGINIMFTSYRIHSFGCEGFLRNFSRGLCLVGVVQPLLFAVCLFAGLIGRVGPAGPPSECDYATARRYLGLFCGEHRVL